MESILNAAVADPLAGSAADDLFVAGTGGQTFFGDAIDFDILVSSGDFNEGLNEVVRIDGQTGAVLGTLSMEGIPALPEGTEGTLLNDPRDVFLSGPFGALSSTVLVNTGFVPPAPGNDLTLEFTQDGDFLGVFAELGDSGFFVDPGGAVFGPEGDVFVGSRTEGTVFQFDGETGASFATEGIPTGGFFDPADIDFPRGFVFSPEGDLFIGNGSNPVTGEGTDNILRVDGATRELTVFAAPEGFSPLDVILSPDGTQLVVSSEFPFEGGSLAAANPGTIFVFDLETGESTTIDPGLDEEGAPLLLAPRGLGFAPDGTLLSSSTANGNVLAFDIGAGTFEGVFTMVESLNGQGFTFVLPEDFDPLSGGIDTVDYSAVASGIVADFTRGLVSFSAEGSLVQDVLVGIENIVGGDGLDTVVLAGESDDAVLSVAAGAVTVVDGDGRESVLTGIERFQFEDGTLALETDPAALEIARLFGVLTGDLASTAALTGGISVIDGGGVTLEGFASTLTALSGLEGPAVSDADFLGSLYETGFGREADAVGFAFWSGLLEADALSRGEVALLFASSNEAAAVFDETQDGVFVFV